MSVTVKIDFLTGRYAATPWGSNPNEGNPEPFPVPWRILRALIAVSYRSPCDRDTLSNLITKLAASPPSYHVPAATQGHVRNPVPVKPKGQAVKMPRRKLLFSFQIYAGSMYVVWQANLDAAERDVLDALLTRVPYLGRSESWVEMSRCDHSPAYCNVVPSDDRVDLYAIAPMSDPELQAFLAEMQQVKLAKRERMLLPASPLAAIEVDYQQVQSQGWSMPPGSRWQGYNYQPLRCQGDHPLKPERLLPRDYATYATFQVEMEGGLLIPPIDLLALTDRMHRALTKISDGHWVFSGREPDQSVSQRDCRHTRFIPHFNRRGQIDRITLYAQAGFDVDAVRSLTRFTRMPNRDRRDWILMLESLTDKMPGLTSSAQWRSLTPMVLPRYPRKRRDFLENQLPRLCQYEGLPELLSFESIPCDRRFQSIPIQRPSRQYQVPSQRYWLRLQFAQPVDRPVVIGHNSHYGLGVFCADQ